MFAKGKGSAVPSDGQAREKLALYVYEYLLHVGAQKSAQTFLSERVLGPVLRSSRKARHL
uniref:LisH domain-containing protein n=1 Tax=Malurus cyaneus samueli TaxID=2593467 RepID=A0A8C5UBP4_9PASS